jgi:class 3 adenylate cyclase
MLFIFCYVFLYCNIDGLLNRFYISNFDISSVNKYDILIKDNTEFFYSLTTISKFILSVYMYYICYYLFVSKMKNITLLAMAFIYSKYTLNVFMSDNITLFEYEYSRAIMWAFTTPLMLKMYCDTNNLRLTDIKFLYHYIPCVTNIIVYPLKNNFMIYNTYVILSTIFVLLFMKQLVRLHSTKYTKIFLSIWAMFVILHFMEITEIVNTYKLNIIYLTADMIGKVTTTIIMYDNKEQDYILQDSIDLQCINFISYMLNKIKKYKINNAKQSAECINLMNYTRYKLNMFVPENKQDLQIELLKKILPLGLDKEYINSASASANVSANVSESTNMNTNANANANANVNANIPFNNICVLFTDIVSYTELANKYNDTVIFDLLNSVYIRFDSIIKRYSHLQKIETIGDAYMVVGDIFRNTDNHKITVKEIILLAIDFVREIKTIKTPDRVPLSIRIGINIGSVVTGILGNEIPRLCVVGNTVNVASRLQSTSEKNTIQISKSMYEIAKDIDFDTNIEYVLKEHVFLKNIGSVNTYNILLD